MRCLNLLWDGYNRILELGLTDGLLYSLGAFLIDVLAELGLSWHRVVLALSGYLHRMFDFFL